MFNEKPALTMTQRKPPGAFFERAPNVLMEKVAEPNSVLTYYRNNGHSVDLLKFYEEVLDAIKLAHLFMEQTKFIHHRNAFLESNYRFLAHYNKELQERLNEYETVETLTRENRLEDVIGRG